MSTPTPDAYHRTEDFESRVDSVMLPDEAWAVFAQFEKPTTAAEIARTIGWETAAVQRQIDLLIEHKLVRKRLVNWRDFLAQKGISTGPTRMSPAAPQSTPAALAAQARRPATPPAFPAPSTPAAERRPAVPVSQSAAAPAAPAQTPAAAASAARTSAPARRVAPRLVEPELPDPEGTVSFRLANDLASRSRRASLAMCITFRLAPATTPRTVRTAPAAAPQTPTTRSRPAATPVEAAPVESPVPEAVAVAVPEPEPVLVAAEGGTTTVPEVIPATHSFAPRKLRSIIDAITRKGGGGLKGQLLVYRVFLRVPPALMYAAGIKSLNLVDDSLELQDERTYHAIRTAAISVASIDLDESVA